MYIEYRFSQGRRPCLIAIHPGLFMVMVEEVRSYLDTDTMLLKNTTLPQYCQMIVNTINSDPSDTLIRQNEVTVAGNTGCKIEWKGDGFYDFEVFTIVE